MTSLGTNVVVIENGRILLTLRGDVPIWCLPGGGVDAGESVAQCAIREVFEETGVEVELTRLVGVYSRPHWGLDGDHVVLFAARPIGGKLRPADGEAVDARYFAPNELPEPLFWWHVQRIADALTRSDAVAYRQDVDWPFGNMTRAQMHELRRQNNLAPQDLIAQLSGPPPANTQTLEVR
ncbi:MAG: NUDIX domain-containing protein [Chloroflexi bacterium]|nr:NUDIX domain-containing protein [Chloroflexota bacterium]